MVDYICGVCEEPFDPAKMGSYRYCSEECKEKYLRGEFD